MFKVKLYEDDELVAEKEAHNVEFSSDLGVRVEYPTELQDVDFDRAEVEPAE